MKIAFNDKQKELLGTFGFEFDINGDLSEDDLLEIDDAVSELLMDEGINEEEEMNELGVLCESIMEMLGE